MRELQRRWRNTVRIDEKLYAPDEMLDRAVLDNQGEEIGVITRLFRVKRTYKGVHCYNKNAYPKGIRR